jgi:hypothetical protein
LFYVGVDLHHQADLTQIAEAMRRGWPIRAPSAVPAAAIAIKIAMIPITTTARPG